MQRLVPQSGSCGRKGLLTPVLISDCTSLFDPSVLSGHSSVVGEAMAIKTNTTRVHCSVIGPGNNRYIITMT